MNKKQQMERSRALKRARKLLSDKGIDLVRDFNNTTPAEKNFYKDMSETAVSFCKTCDILSGTSPLPAAEGFGNYPYE